MAGETKLVAEAEEAIVVIPVILEVVEVELEVAIGVPVHVRHPVVTVGMPHQQYAMRHPFHRKRLLSPPEFYSEPYARKRITPIYLIFS